VFAEGLVVSIGWRKAAITRLDSGLNAATALREFRLDFPESSPTLSHSRCPMTLQNGRTSS
jgi:hypothetical protein